MGRLTQDDVEMYAEAARALADRRAEVEGERRSLTSGLYASSHVFGDVEAAYRYEALTAEAARLQKELNELGAELKGLGMPTGLYVRCARGADMDGRPRKDQKIQVSSGGQLTVADV